jgi:hypothetical protein
MSHHVRPRVVIATLALLSCIATSTALAQVVITSSIVGNVTDPQNAVVPGATVTLTNTDTGVESTTVTNAAGDYQFSNLIAGTYVVHVGLQGFADAESTPLALQNGVSARVNVVLKVGQAAEVVKVEGATGLLKTEDASVSEVIQQKFVSELPTEGRNFLNFAQMVPMFNSGTGDDTRVNWGLASATAPGGGKQLNVGGSEYGVGYYVDGLNNNDNWTDGVLMNINLDSVQEVKVEVVNYSAEYGRDVGQISLTTKSGTNSLRGTVYDFYQNADLNANDAYSNAIGSPKEDYHQHQYGFTVGGPVVLPRLFNGRDKMFFFGSFEQFRNRSANTFHAYVPTDAEKRGDFSQWLAEHPGDPRFVIYNPFTFDPETQTRQPYPNNVISSPNPIALEYLSHFPAPNGYRSPLADEGDYNNYEGRTTNGIDNDNYSLRIDYNFGRQDRLYFRYSYDYGTKLNEGGLIPELALGNGPVHKVHTYQGHWLRTFGSSLVNDLGISFTDGWSANEQSSGIRRYMETTWFSNLFRNTSTAGGGFTQYDLDQLGIEDDGLFALGFAGELFAPLGLGTSEYYYQVVPVFQITDNVTKIVGRHTLKAGFNYSRRDERDNDVIRSLTIGGWCGWCGQESNYTASSPFAFDGSGWNTLAEFVTGAVFTMNQRTPLTNGDGSLYFRTHEFAGFVNDVWQARPDLTISLGLRYDIGTPTYSVDSYWGVLDKSYPGYRLVMPGLTPGTKARPFPTDKNNVAPRVSVAYRPSENTVVRAGYGLFYETGRNKYMDQVFWNSPGYGGSTYASPDYASIAGLDPNQVYFTLNDVFPAPIMVEKGTWPLPLGEKGGSLFPRQDATTIDKESATSPEYHRWSIDVQRQFGSKVVANVGYVGSKGSRLTMAEDLNLPPEGVYFDDEEYYQARPLSAEYPDRWGTILAVHHNRRNDYHAVNAGLKTQNWHGLTTIVNYTWSRQRDDYFGMGGYDNNHALGGQWHPEWSYGESDANHPHRFVGAVIYELPGASMSNRVLREALGGWQLSTIATFESGGPWTVWNGDTSSYDRMGDVPDQVCDGNIPASEQSVTRWFDTSCFVNPSPIDPETNIASHRGNARRNSLRGPGINNWDMSLSKSFRAGGARQFQVRVDAFNVFNHTQWAAIDTYNDTATNPDSQFGWITEARPGRRVQLSGKFLF